MSRDALITSLRRVALMQGLTPFQITEIMRRADRIVYKPGDTIIAADAEADAAILIVSGTAERRVGPALSGKSETLPAGVILGEMAMLIDTCHSSTVIAATKVRALRIARSEMHELMAEEPAVAEHFIAKIAARLAKLANEMRDIDGVLAPIAPDANAAPNNVERSTVAPVALH